jgi:integrase
MPGPLIAALEARKVEQDAEREAALNEWVDTGLVFTTVWGKAIDPRQDWAEWHSILREAGVPPARLQDARHTAATFLLVQGVDLRVVMDLMGWSQASMAKRYQHVVDVLRREAARRMESLLWPAEPVPPPPPIAPPRASVDSDTSTDHATEGGAKIIQFRRKAV